MHVRSAACRLKPHSRRKRSSLAACLSLAVFLMLMSSGRQLPCVKKSGHEHMKWSVAQVISPSTRPAPVRESTTLAGDLNESEQAEPQHQQMEFPQYYRVRTGLGSQSAGMVNARVEGTVGGQHPDQAMLTYRRRWRSGIGGFKPLATLRATLNDYSASLRWSKPVLQKRAVEIADGSGLDLHLETRLQGRWPSPQDFSEFNETPESISSLGIDMPSWQQRMEIVFGPRAQAELLNLTLPFGILLGAVLSPSEPKPPNTYAIGATPVSFYLRLHWPDSPEFHGVLCEAEVEDSWAGLFRAAFRRPWRTSSQRSSRFVSDWYVEHLRTHGPVVLPHCVTDGIQKQIASLSRYVGMTAPMRSLDETIAVPSSRFRMGSAGGSAALALDSLQYGDSSDWGGTLEMNRQGWRSRARLSSGGRGNRWGKASYTFGMLAPWHSKSVSDKLGPDFSHELQWLRSDGQGLWGTLQHAQGKRPRVNFGMELR